MNKLHSSLLGSLTAISILSIIAGTYLVFAVGESAFAASLTCYLVSFVSTATGHYIVRRIK